MHHLSTIIAHLALFASLAQAFCNTVDRSYPTTLTQQHQPLRSIGLLHSAPRMSGEQQNVMVLAAAKREGGTVQGKDQRVSSSKMNYKQAGSILFLTTLLDKYSSLLDTNPYVTKIVSSFLVGGLGDMLIQAYERRETKQPIDLRRLLVFSSVTGIYIAPVINLWFNFLASMPFLATMTNLKKAFWMMFVDQTVGATIITIGFFFAFEMAQALIPHFNGPAKSTSKNFLAAGWRSTTKNLKETMIANWYCWPIINFVNFLIIPLNYRVLFANFCAVFWNMFLSSVANRSV